MNKLVFLLSLSLFFSNTSWAASAQGTGTVSAQVVLPVSIDNSKTLNFGTVLGESGIVTISTSGNRTSTSASHLVNDASNEPSEGEMLIYGPENQVVYIQTISDTVITSGGSASMDVTNFQTDPTGSMTLAGEDGSPVKIGAQLTVGDHQAMGSYTGSYTLSVTY